MHEPGPWMLADEKSDRDNFHTSIYGSPDKGLLIARGNQNGVHGQDMVLMRAAPEMLRLLREARFQITGETAAAIDKLIAFMTPFQ